MKHPSTLPSLVFADSRGNIADFPDLKMTGMSGGHSLPPERRDIIPLPEGSELFTLPGRLPIGWDPQQKEPVLLAENPYTDVRPPDIQAVAAFIAPAYTSILNSSYQRTDGAPILPLFAYTAVGWLDGRFWVPAFRSDPDVRQDITQYTPQQVREKTKKKLARFSHNRLVRHLGKCCLTYGCPAARNFFLGRWEAPLPVSPVCNARCLGCISLQEAGACASQERINFVPSPEEICEIAVPHLEKAANPIVSFGQECEGEPLLQTEVLSESIRMIRKKTRRGTINLNSNASLPENIEQLAKAGLDSLRVSLNSAQESCYHAYYRPKNYHFTDVLHSIDIMKQYARFVSLNYFIMPGFTDSQEESTALCQLIERHQPDFIQLRNLNMDPEQYLERLPTRSLPVTEGIRPWLNKLKAQFPALRFGYFNPQLN